MLDPTDPYVLLGRLPMPAHQQLDPLWHVSGFQVFLYAQLDWPRIVMLQTFQAIAAQLDPPLIAVVSSP